MDGSLLAVRVMILVGFLLAGVVFAPVAYLILWVLYQILTM